MTAKAAMQLVLWNDKGEIADTVEIPLELPAPDDADCYETAMLVAQHAERMLQGLRRRALQDARPRARRAAALPSVGPGAVS